MGVGNPWIPPSHSHRNFSCQSANRTSYRNFLDAWLCGAVAVYCLLFEKNVLLLCGLMGMVEEVGEGECRHV
jgi:hypothetical protein